MNRLILGLAVLACVSGAYAQGCCGGGEPKAQNAQTDTAKLEKGVQKARVTVQNGGYSPATIKVKAGKPVEIAFRLGEKPGCGGQLVVKDLKVDKKLSADKDTLVKFTPSKKGKIAFTCGMGMYKGTIVVE